MPLRAWALSALRVSGSRLQQGRTNEGLHALLWPVSRLLVRYVEANAADFRGARVLELGAGVVRATRAAAQLSALGSPRKRKQGLAGIGAAAYGAHVLLTDKARAASSAHAAVLSSSNLLPLALAPQLTGLTAANVAAAAAVGVAGSVACGELDWAEAEAWLAGREASGASNAFDVVLGADIVYHQQFDFGPVRALAALLAALLRAAPACRVLFGYQERDAAARTAFWDALRDNGLHLRERSLDHLTADGVDTAGLSGPMVMWWISATPAAEEPAARSSEPAAA